MRSQIIHQAKKLLFIGWLFCFTNCSEPEAKKGLDLYFSLEGYFTAEISSLQQKDLHLKKAMSHNNETDSIVIHKPDWRHELKAFIAEDINKPAYRGVVDSTTETEGDDVVTLYNLKLKDETRIIHVYRDSSGVKKVKIEKYKNNFIFSSSSELVYIPSRSYSISSRSNVFNMWKTDAIVNAQLTP